jgi:protein-disulfide isomerase
VDAKESVLEKHKEEVRRNRMKTSNYWKYTTIVLLVIVLFGIYTMNTNGVNVAEDPDAIDNAISYINDELLLGLATAQLIESTDLGTIYKLDLNIVTTDGAAEAYTSYVSKDGTLLFPEGIEIVLPEIVESDGPSEEDFEQALIDAGVELDEFGNIIDPILIVDPSSLTGDNEEDIVGTVEIEETQAKVTIYEYSDFQCPYCAGAYPTINLVKETYGSEVEVIFKHFPIAFHQYAQKAAEASECARDQGMFWEYHDLLFENQDKLKDKHLKEYAGDLSLDMDMFNSCLASGEKAETVALDIAEGKEMGVTGTPTFFIGEETIVGAASFESFQTAIDAALAA